MPRRTMRKEQSAFAKFCEKDSEQVRTRTDTIYPNTGLTVGLGLYDKTEPKPVFKVICNPAEMSDQIGALPGELDIPGEPNSRLMIYMFQNFGSKPCDVTLTRVEHQNDGSR